MSVGGTGGHSPNSLSDSSSSAVYPTTNGGSGNLGKDYFGDQKLSLAAAAAAGNCNQSVAFRAAAAAAVAYGRGAAAGYGGYAPDVVAAAAASDVDKYI